MPSKREAWETFSRALGRKPLLAYLQPASQQASQGQQPASAAPTSIVQPAPTPAQQPQPPSPAPQAQAQPQLQQPAPISTSTKPQPASQPAQAPSPQQPAQIPQAEAPRPAPKAAPTSRRNLEGLGRIRVKCPRCGQWGRLYADDRGYRDYLYVKHSSNNVCYIGPLDGYVAVQELHGHLALTNLRSINYAEVIAYAAEKLFEQLEKKNGDEDGKIDEEELMHGIITIAEVIRDACNKLAARSQCIERVMRTLLL